MQCHIFPNHQYLQSRKRQTSFRHLLNSRKVELAPSTVNKTAARMKNQEVEEAIREAQEIRKQAERIKIVRMQALARKIKRADENLRKQLEQWKLNEERFKAEEKRVSIEKVQKSEGNEFAQNLEKNRPKMVQVELEASRKIKMPLQFEDIRRYSSYEPLRFPSHKNIHNRLSQHYELYECVTPLQPIVHEPKVVILNEKEERQPVVSSSKPTCSTNNVVSK